MMSVVCVRCVQMMQATLVSVLSPRDGFVQVHNRRRPRLICRSKSNTSGTLQVGIAAASTRASPAPAQPHASLIYIRRRARSHMPNIVYITTSNTPLLKSTKSCCDVAPELRDRLTKLFWKPYNGALTLYILFYTNAYFIIKLT